MATIDLNPATLTLRQRDILILLVNTNSGSAVLEPDTALNFELKLRAAKALQALGVVSINGESAWPDYIVSLTAEGEAWLLGLPEGALTADLAD